MGQHLGVVPTVHRADCYNRLLCRGRSSGRVIEVMRNRSEGRSASSEDLMEVCALKGLIADGCLGGEAFGLHACKRPYCGWVHAYKRTYSQSCLGNKDFQMEEVRVLLDDIQGWW